MPPLFAAYRWFLARKRGRTFDMPSLLYLSGPRSKTRAPRYLRGRLAISRGRRRRPHGRQGAGSLLAALCRPARWSLSVCQLPRPEFLKASDHRRTMAGWHGWHDSPQLTALEPGCSQPASNRRNAAPLTAPGWEGCQWMTLRALSATGPVQIGLPSSLSSLSRRLRPLAQPPYLETPGPKWRPISPANTCPRPWIFSWQASETQYIRYCLAG